MPISPMDGNRPLPFDRDELGQMVRDAWVRWALTQSDPKPSWLVPYHLLSENDKEADRQIGETIARWTLIGDAARFASDSKSRGICEYFKASVMCWPWRKVIRVSVNAGVGYALCSIIAGHWL